jgi:hypothetical protein
LQNNFFKKKLSKGGISGCMHIWNSNLKLWFSWSFSTKHSLDSWKLTAQGLNPKSGAGTGKKRKRVQIITPAISLQLSFDGCHDMGIEMSCNTVHTHLLIMLLHMRSVHWECYIILPRNELFTQFSNLQRYSLSWDRLELASCFLSTSVQGFPSNSGLELRSSVLLGVRNGVRYWWDRQYVGHFLSSWKRRESAKEIQNVGRSVNWNP